MSYTERAEHIDGGRSVTATEIEDGAMVERTVAVLAGGHMEEACQLF